VRCAGPRVEGPNDGSRAAGKDGGGDCARTGGDDDGHRRDGGLGARGPTASEGVAQFFDGLAKQQGVSPAELERQFFAAVRPTSLLKRFETPEEVAAV